MKDPELTMDQSNHSQNQHQQSPAVGVIPTTGQMSYATLPYPTTPISQPFPHQQLQQQQQQQVQAFWDNQMREIEQTTDFKNHSLPLARIKKIMKADEDVRMISAEAPVIFAKACEMFILELTLRSWLHTEENKRRTLQKNDIAAAISRTDVFDFLVDIIPRDELKEEGIGMGKGMIPVMGSPTDPIPYYYMPPQHPGMVMGKTGMGDQSNVNVYGGQQLQPPPLAYMPWPQQQAEQPQTDS